MTHNPAYDPPGVDAPEHRRRLWASLDATIHYLRSAQGSVRTACGILNTLGRHSESDYFSRIQAELEHCLIQTDHLFRPIDTARTSQRITP